MRVIGGSLGGRRFSPPKNNWPTRPTTDMAREGLFNILTNQIDFTSIKALDLFGGVGSQSFELYSRGCKDVTYVERFHGCIGFVKEQTKAFKAESSIRIIRADVFKFLKKSEETCDYIFADPPYGLNNLNELPEMIFSRDMLSDDGIFVIEHDMRNSFEEYMHFHQERKYGDSRFSFFSKSP